MICKVFLKKYLKNFKNCSIKYYYYNIILLIFNFKGVEKNLYINIIGYNQYFNNSRRNNFGCNS